jgi:hypothetical protein
MKRVALLLTGAFFLTLQGIAQNGDLVEIPDTAFLYALIDVGVDTDEDSLISIAEAEAVSTLMIMNRGITDMTGIEAFVMLDTLICDNNSIDTLNLATLSGLEMLSCGSNPIDSLDLSDNTELLGLYVFHGELTFLNLSNNAALTRLELRYNTLTNLDLLNNVALCTLDVRENNLSNLDVSANVNLEILNCYENPLEGLDVTNNHKLKVLLCHGDNNVIDTLDLSKNKLLEYLNCGNSLNSLTIPDSSALRSLNCAMNNLESVDVSGCPYLEYFYPFDNNITSLDLSNNPLLYWLSCEINQLTELDVSNNPELNILWCGENQLTTLDLSQNSKIGSISEQYVHLNLDNMPSLTEVCVWDSFPGDITISYDGCPNICFEKGEACDGLCPNSIERFDHSDFKIYPNPASDILTIETPAFGPHSIQLHTLNGQEIYHATFTGTLHQLDLSFCKKGIYFLHIRSDNLSATRKVVKL